MICCESYSYRIVRLISPNLNYLIIAGAIMLYASVYFFLVSSTDPFLVTFSCHVSRYSILYSLYFFSIICSKKIIVRLCTNVKNYIGGNGNSQLRARLKL